MNADGTTLDPKNIVLLSCPNFNESTLHQEVQKLVGVSTVGIATGRALWNSQDIESCKLFLTHQYVAKIPSFRW